MMGVEAGPGKKAAGPCDRRPAGPTASFCSPVYPYTCSCISRKDAMPPLPAVPKVIAARFIHTFQEDVDVVNRVFFQYSGAVSQTDLNTLATSFKTAWDSNVMPALSNSLVHTDTELTDLSSSTSPVSGVTGSVAGGDATHASLAANSAIVIGMDVARRYRGGHPRLYLGGMHINMLNDVQTLTSAFIASMLTDFQNFITGCTTAPPAAVGTLIQVNVSYFQGFTNHTFPSGRVRPI